MHAKYIDFRKWFFKEFSAEQQQIYKNQFYNYIDEKEEVIPFVEWFYNCYENTFPDICVIDEFYKSWKTIGD